MSTASTAPFHLEAYNRFRLSHQYPDTTAHLGRRLNRLPYLQKAGGEDVAAEEELARLELQKHIYDLEHTEARTKSLRRQEEEYRAKATATLAETEALRQTIVEEKAQLAAEQIERDFRMRCDDIAHKIVARGKSRAQLDDEIATLQASIREHRSRLDSVLSVAHARAEAFGRVMGIVDECRSFKMPIFDDEDETTDAADSSSKVDSKSPSPTPTTRLNATSLPFQPTASSSSSGPSASHSAPQSRAATPSAHGLPARPGMPRAAARYPASRGNLPQRPSGLRTVTGGLEDGEVGPEDGEVTENGKRKAVDDGRSASTRQKR